MCTTGTGQSTVYWDVMNRKKSLNIDKSKVKYPSKHCETTIYNLLPYARFIPHGMNVN